MDIAAPDDPKKRKLPLWMMGVSGADKVSKSLNVDVTNTISKKDVGVASLTSQPKRKRKTAHGENEVPLPSEEALEVQESSVLVKCRMVRRKRGVSTRDDGSDDEAKEIRGGKKTHGVVGRKSKESVPLKRRKAKRLESENDDDIEVSSPGDNNGDDNDDDLTMEDLMSFAKEYVKDDNDEGQQQPSDVAPRAISQSKDAALFGNENNVILSRKEGLEVEQPSLNVKRGMKERKEEACRSDTRRDANAKDIGGARKKHGGVKRRVVEHVPSKSKTAKSSRLKSNGDIDVQSPGDDDDDLTMDDLMSIAKEFVEDDKDERRQQLDGVLRAENRPVYAAIDRSETGHSTIEPQISRSPIHEEASSPRSSTDNVTSKIIIGKPIMTGDPAQDMLNLILGPLLNKPAWEGKKASLVSEETKASLVSGDIAFSQEVKTQNENLVIANAPAPLTKKKSSLKDKVAMFFD